MTAPELIPFEQAVARITLRTGLENPRPLLSEAIASGRVRSPDRFSSIGAPALDYIPVLNPGEYYPGLRDDRANMLSSMEAQLLLLADVDTLIVELLDGSRLRAPLLKLGGRPQKYAWAEAEDDLFAHVAGLNSTMSLADAERWMSEWFSRHNKGSPSESLIRDHARAVVTRHRKSADREFPCKAEN